MQPPASDDTSFPYCPMAIPASTMPLSTAPVNCPLIVRELKAAPAACLRLREMGFCESTPIWKLNSGSNLICQVCGVRVALGKQLSSLVYVEPYEYAQPYEALSS